MRHIQGVNAYSNKKKIFKKSQGMSTATSFLRLWFELFTLATGDNLERQHFYSNTSVTVWLLYFFLLNLHKPFTSASPPLALTLLPCVCGSCPIIVGNKGFFISKACTNTLVTVATLDKRAYKYIPEKTRRPSFSIHRARSESERPITALQEQIGTRELVHFPLTIRFNFLVTVLFRFDLWFWVLPCINKN